MTQGKEAAESQAATFKIKIQDLEELMKGLRDEMRLLKLRLGEVEASLMRVEEELTRTQVCEKGLLSELTTLRGSVKSKEAELTQLTQELASQVVLNERLQDGFGSVKHANEVLTERLKAEAHAKDALNTELTVQREENALLTQSPNPDPNPNPNWRRIPS